MFDPMTQSMYAQREVLRSTYQQILNYFKYLLLLLLPCDVNNDVVC